MIYTYKTRKAMRLCYKAHDGQEDKSGVPYVFHPLHVAEQMDDEDSTIVALLHDVAEDTDYTLEDIEKKKFGAHIIEALRLLTHDDAVPYMDYVANIKANPIARAVKLADLRHNSDLSRLDTVDEKALRRCEKYAEAIRLLTE
jgi:(p)ppGpp synthase/HD superfamily hydrolase